MIINNDGHTYISASTGSDVHIRGGDNTSTYQIVVYPDAYATSAGSTIITEAGSGLSKSSRTLSHADTSSQASVNNSNGTVIQDITLDTYGHITGINSVNLDGRYYTESEADSRFVNVTGDTMTGVLIPDTSGDYDQTAITSLTNAPINYPEVNVGSSDTYLPAFHMRSVHSGGYRTHMNVGLHKDSSGWGGSSTGFYVALGGNDNNPTEAYKLTYGGEINHTVAGRFFADNYHPNADKWTTARTLSLSGDASGSVSWDGSANATLSVTVANDSHTHDGRYYTESEADSRFVNASGDTMTGQLIIDHNTSSMLKLQATNSGPWAIELGRDDATASKVYNGGGYWYFEHRPRFAGNTAFDDGYHPNADKWTTARTLTLSGDASGSVSWDGSANATLSVAVANDSHTHDGRYYTETEADSRFVNVTGDTMTGSLNIGAAIGSRANTISIDGDANSSPIVIQCDTVDNAWGILPWTSGETYIHGGVYYDDGVWVHRSSNTTNYLLRLNGGTGAGWYASNNSTGSWNVASNVSLWNSSGTWIGAVAKSPTLTLSGDVSGSATFTNLGDATLSVTVADDSHSHSTYIASNANDDVTGNTEWQDNYQIRLGNGADFRMWHNGTDTYFRNYLHATGSFYWQGEGTGGVNHNLISMHNDTTTPYVRLYYDSNVVLETVSGGINIAGNTAWHAGNDGSGSGLDADLLDGIQGSSFLRSDANDTFSGTLDAGNSLTAAYRFDGRGFSWNSAMQTPSTHIPHIMQQSYGGWDPVIGIKTTDGFWQFGAYSSNTLHLGYMAGAFGSHSTNAFDNSLTISPSTMTFNGYTIWHGGNDGSGSGLDADRLDGYHASTTRDAPQTVPVRDSSGYLQLGWINTTSGQTTNTIDRIYASNDTYLRYITPATLVSQLGLWTSGNDGSGSGLDADKVDGVHGSSFIRSDAADNVTANTEWQDNYKIHLGNEADFGMYFNGSHTYFINYNHSNGNIYFQGEDTEGTNHALLYMFTNTSRPYTVLYENGGECLRTTSYGVEISGELRASSNIIAYYSDERLKTKVGGIENPLDKVKSLEGFYYFENDIAKDHGFNNNEKQVALSAQAVQEVMPEAVDLAPFDTATDEEGNIYSKSGKEYLTVDYARLVPLLVESIKELEKRVAELEAKQ